MHGRWLNQVLLGVIGLIFLTGCTLELSFPQAPVESQAPLVTTSTTPIEGATSKQAIPDASAPVEEAMASPMTEVSGCPGGIELPAGVDPRACGPVPDDATNGGRGERFITPSENIACLMGEDDVMCQALDTAMIEDFDNPEGDGQCDGFWLGTSADFLCHSESPLWDGRESDPTDWPALNYGDTVAVFQYVCASENNGLTCWNGETGHGFFLSRSRYTHW